LPELKIYYKGNKYKQKDAKSQPTNNRIDKKYYSDLINNNDFVYLLKFKSTPS